jgi:hypothetical protein
MTPTSGLLICLRLQLQRICRCGVLEYEPLNTALGCGITFCSQHNLSYFRCIKRLLSLSSSLAAIEHDVSHALSAVSAPPVPSVFYRYALFNIGYLLANILLRVSRDTITALSISLSYSCKNVFPTVEGTSLYVVVSL